MKESKNLNDFKVNFTLRGHTPLIHFEKLSELTLRPTELKSKLDKFLINNGYIDEFHICKSEDGKKYLKYKVILKNIKISEKKDIKKITRDNRKFETYPFYFGNMGNEYNDGDKKLVFIENVDVEFFSFNKEIIKAIKNHFEEFVAITNFGTRQNKGYGSFYLKDKEFNEEFIKKMQGYKVNINNTDYKETMSEMELFYKFLRSGINLSTRSRSPFYTKPAIWKYFKEKGIVWEKKAIKRRCFRSQLNKQKEKHNNPDILTYEGDEKIVRDLLGLSTIQEWMSYGISVKKENDKIKRFKSPLMFKFIKTDKGYDVYFWNEKRFEEKLEDFCNKKFAIKAGRCEFELSTAEFDLDNFLEWVYKKRKTILSELSDDNNASEYKRINKILNNIQKVN